MGIRAIMFCFGFILVLSLMTIGESSRMYPPSPLMQDTSILRRQRYGNGNHSTLPATSFRAFDMNTTTFYSSSPSYNSTGSYGGTSETFYGGSYDSYFGDYVEIELPQRIYLMAVELWPRQSEETAYRPTKFAVFGYAGSDSWSMLLQVAAPQWRSNGSTTWNISETTQRYKRFRLAVDEITQGTAGSFQVAEIVLHGHEHRLYEFPPGPMTDTTTTFGSEYSVGAGEYSILSSSGLTLNAFDRSIATVF
eukprot:gene16793-19154_t